MPDFSQIALVDVLPFIAVGFLAQLVDGALGMAFGVISSTVMVALLGVPPAHASAGVHFAEVFTTGASGISHAAARNIDWRLFRKLAIPGVIGGVAGAWVIGTVDASFARPLVMAYLAVIGVSLLWRAWRFPLHPSRDPRLVGPLGLAGGFLDAAGGGGWGPVTMSNLLIQGGNPRTTIGTVNAAEFLLTASVSATFIATMGLAAFTAATVGLVVGGLAAAPFGALIARRAPPRVLLGLVGAVLTITSAFSLWSWLR